MTEVQKVLMDLKYNKVSDKIIECFETKYMNNGYYKLYLTNGKYSYVTNENFLKIKPYICYIEKHTTRPIDKFINNILINIEQYTRDLQSNKK